MTLLSNYNGMRAPKLRCKNYVALAQWAAPPTMTKLFLGVDGGQSTTTALIGDETGSVLGVGQGGPCNHVGAAEGRAKLTRAVQECVAKACAQAGLNPAQTRYEAACFGMSGGPDDKEALLAEILPANRLI